VWHTLAKVDDNWHITGKLNCFDHANPAKRWNATDANRLIALLLQADYSKKGSFSLGCIVMLLIWQQQLELAKRNS